MSGRRTDAIAYGPDAAARLVAQGRVMIVADGVDELPVHLQAAALGGPAKMAAGCCHWLRSVRLNSRLPADVFRDPAVNRAIGGSRESAAPRLCLLEPRRAARPAPRKLEACGTDSPVSGRKSP